MEINYEFIDIKNERLFQKVKNFLADFDLRYTKVDTTLVGWHENEIVAVCSKLNNLIKNIAVSPKFSGLNVTNSLITKMFSEIKKQNFDNVFVITKFINKQIFLDLNFKLIYENSNVVFLAWQNESFVAYKNYIQSQKFFSKTAVIVLNANPLTNGHLHLIKTASLENDHVYLIPVLEDISFFTYEERNEIIKANIVDLKNVTLLQGSEFLISKNFFPSYFLQSDEQTILEQANLDASLFSEFFENKNIIRYVGDEPFSKTTNSYNEVLKKVFKSKNFNLKIIERKQLNNIPISASQVRRLLFENNLVELKTLVTQKTFNIISQKKFLSRAQEHPELIFKSN